MKTTTTLLLAAALLTSCSYRRVGSLTMVSTRNVDRTKDYVLLLRGVEAKAKTKHDDALQEAIDAAVRNHPHGEYMMNAVVYVKSNGNWVKVTGDLYGLAGAENVASPVTTGTVAMATGDRVAFKLTGRVTEGTIVGLRTTTAMVEVAMPNGTKQLREVELEKLTRLP